MPFINIESTGIVSSSIAIGPCFNSPGCGTQKASEATSTTFFKVTAGATRVQRLFGRSMGIVRVNGQYSPNKLFAAEQMQMAGPYTLRGYQPAELIGDYGVTGTVEYRFPVPLLCILRKFNSPVYYTIPKSNLRLGYCKICVKLYGKSLAFNH